jgi:hypothetical protein
MSNPRKGNLDLTDTTIGFAEHGLSSHGLHNFDELVLCLFGKIVWGWGEPRSTFHSPKSMELGALGVGQGNESFTRQ